MKNWFISALLLLPPATKAADLKKYNPQVLGGFDIYASSPVTSNTVIPASLQASNSPSSGQVPTKGTGDYFTWASAGAGDAILASTQTFTGANTFTSTVTLTDLNSQATYRPAGRLFVVQHSSMTTDSGTSVKTFYTYSLPANLLNTSSSTVHVEFFGGTAANSNNKSLFLTVGTSTCATVSSLGINNGGWRLSCEIISNGINSQTMWGLNLVKATSGSTVQVVPSTMTATQTTTSTLDVSIKGQQGATPSGDIVFSGGSGYFWP